MPMSAPEWKQRLADLERSGQPMSLIGPARPITRLQYATASWVEIGISRGCPG
jgi:hypothetical protein